VKCNGWTNYETWSVYLHFFDGFEADGEEYSADMCQAWVEESSLGVEVNSFAYLIVHQFLSEVNWQEIADHINEK
jgi:hypothetical protein